MAKKAHHVLFQAVNLIQVNSFILGFVPSNSIHAHSQMSKFHTILQNYSRNLLLLFDNSYKGIF